MNRFAGSGIQCVVGPFFSGRVMIQTCSRVPVFSLCVLSEIDRLYAANIYCILSYSVSAEGIIFPLVLGG